MPYAARILVPTDFSAASSLALDHALTLAEVFRASLHILHVASGSPSSSDADVALAGVLSRCAGERVVATSQVAGGSPSEAIVRTAVDRGVDLIVMGTHGRQGLSHLVLGSVAEHVLRTAPCPVMTVRGPIRERVSVPDAAELQPCGS